MVRNNGAPSPGRKGGGMRNAFLHRFVWKETGTVCGSWKCYTLNSGRHKDKSPPRLRNRKVLGVQNAFIYEIAVGPKHPNKASIRAESRNSYKPWNIFDQNVSRLYQFNYPAKFSKQLRIRLS